MISEKNRIFILISVLYHQNIPVVFHNMFDKDAWFAFAEISQLTSEQTKVFKSIDTSSRESRSKNDRNRKK